VALRLARERIGADEAARFRERGYAVMRRAFDAAAVARIDAWTSELLALPEVPGRHWVYRDPSLVDPTTRLVTRIERIAPFHAGFRELVEALKPPVEELLGEPAVLFKEKVNFKMPGADGFKPHQDAQAGWTAYADVFVSALVSIDRANAANGCLQIVENYRHERLFQLWEPLSEAQLAGLRWVDLPTEPGDVIFFDCFVPHASQPNRTGAMRRIYYATYNRASAGDHSARYYADKHRNFPPDIDREPGRTYVFRV
jgi:hypothetical protein